MRDGLKLTEELVNLVGPPGQEDAVRLALEQHLDSMGLAHETDAKGNLLACWPAKPEEPARPRLAVTAHMDEIALFVFSVEHDGILKVRSLGGAQPWKWGEGPVDILTREGPVPGILSFGSMHTASPASVSQQIRSGPLTWELCSIFTGLSRSELTALGIRPGSRVGIGQSRRVISRVGPYVGSYFLDDRAALAVWLMALEELKSDTDLEPVAFAATVAEEVGGEGAAFLLHEMRPAICVALEIGPKTVEHSFPLDAYPTVWVHDSYAAMAVQDMDIIAECCHELGLIAHWQGLTSAGSDATIASSRGAIARPVTLGLPVDNSHGYEIMHRDALIHLTRLLVTYIKRVARKG
ncbi:MAG: hypothetical protein IT210_05910 [Armatimonadetes bacterium]|nr:hypothetical protein [Armatimonadota bacterium]